mgnify:CR=1 FL=1
MKRTLSLFLFIVMIGVGLQSETVFVSVLEQTPDMTLYNFEASSAWESGVLDALFDMGAIVSNTPIQAFLSFDKNEALQLARDGGADSLLVVKLDYLIIPKEKTNIRPVPGTVHYSLYSVLSGKLLKQLSYNPSSLSERVEEDKNMAKQQTQVFYK